MWEGAGVWVQQGGSLHCKNLHNGAVSIETSEKVGTERGGAVMGRSPAWTLAMRADHAAGVRQEGGATGWEGMFKEGMIPGAGHQEQWVYVLYCIPTVDMSG